MAADLHADGIVARDGEHVDAVAVRILHVDAVKERSVLIVGRGVGGDVTFNGVLLAAAAVRNLLDGADGGELFHAARLRDNGRTRLCLAVSHRRSGSGVVEQRPVRRDLAAKRSPL